MDLDHSNNLISLRNRKLEEKARHSADGFPMKLYWNDFSQYVSQQIPWHWHMELEFAVVCEGEVSISIGADTLNLIPGDAVFINSNALHKMIPTSDEPAYMFTIVANPSILSIDPAFLFGSKYITPYTGQEQISYEHFRPDGGWRETVIQKLRDIYSCYGNDPWYEYRVHNLLCDIWLLLLQFCWNQPAKPKKEIREERLRQMLKFIHDEYRRNLSLEDICNSAHISKTECCRCFQQTLQMTPFDYLSFYRVSVAADQLRQTNRTITQIALDTGFRSNSYFGKVFRNYIGKTPLQYRNSTG